MLKIKCRNGFSLLNTNEVSAIISITTLTTVEIGKSKIINRAKLLDMLNDKCTDNCFSGELGVLVDCGWISYITVKYEQN